MAERLDWAVQRQPRQGRRRGFRLFVRRMQERAAELAADGTTLPGVHLSSIQGYVSGAVEPPVRFLEEAADVLGVRRAWLLAGSGAPTQEEEEIRASWQTAEEWISETAALGLEQGIAVTFAGYAFVPHAVRAAVWRALRSFEQYAIEHPATIDGTDRTSNAIGELLGAYLNTPIELLALDPETVPPDVWALMISALLQPIDIAAAMQRHRVEEND